MPAYDYDLFSIGAGSGGVRASRVAAKLGARVAVAEERYLGGTCVNAGCIPKKLLVYASSFRDEVEDAASFGWKLAAQDVDWATLLANKDREIGRLNRIYGQLLDEAGVDRLEGRARVVEDDPELLERLVEPGYGAKPEQAIVFEVEAWDVNCPQHITPRYTEDQIAPALAKLQARIDALEAEVKELRGE